MGYGTPVDKFGVALYSVTAAPRRCMRAAWSLARQQAMRYRTVFFLYLTSEDTRRVALRDVPSFAHARL